MYVWGFIKYLLFRLGNRIGLKRLKAVKQFFFFFFFFNKFFLSFFNRKLMVHYR